MTAVRKAWQGTLSRRFVASLFAAGILVTAGRAVEVLPSAHAEEETSAATVSLQESRVYTLEELTRLIREQSGVKVYADNKHQGRRIFASQGSYGATELIAALRAATGMTLRHVGQTRFLAAHDPTLGHKLHFPLLPAKLLSRLGEVLRPLATRADLRKQGIPFAPADFLARESGPFGELTPPQQEFVARAATLIPRQDVGKPGPAKMVMDEAVLRKRVAELQTARVRLGTSYLMVVRPYRRPTSPEQRLSGPYVSIFQVYYDYRDRYAVELPED